MQMLDTVRIFTWTKTLSEQEIQKYTLVTGNNCQGEDLLDLAADKVTIIWGHLSPSPVPKKEKPPNWYPNHTKYSPCRNLTTYSCCANPFA